MMPYHRYTVAFACATNFALTIGSSLCLGVFTEIFMDSFAINNAQVSIVMSVPISVLCIMSPFVLPLIKKLGCRRSVMLSGLLSSGCFIVASFQTNYVTFLLTIGVFLGLLFSIVYTCSILVVPQIFLDQKSRQIAFSLTNVGAGVGGLVFPVLYETLLSYYSWRQTLFITGAIMLHFVPLGMLLPEHLSDHMDKETDSEGDMSGRKRAIWKSFTFLLLQTCLFTLQGVTSGFFAFVYPLLCEHGYTAGMTVTAMIIIQGSTIPGRLTPSFTRDLIKVHTLYQFCVFTVLFGVGVISICLLGGVWLVTVVGGVLVGYGMGCMFSIFPIAMSDLYHDSQLHFALTISLFSSGLGGFLVPIGVGFLVDHSQTYITPLSGIGTVMVSMFTFLAIYRFFRQICKGN